jgi:hypothetical protein
MQIEKRIWVGSRLDVVFGESRSGNWTRDNVWQGVTIH